MAKYIVADPDGVKHIIQGPDGASPDDVIRQAQAVVPYKPRAGMNGRNMTNPQAQQQPAPQGRQQQQQGPNPFMQLVLSRLGVQMPDPQKQAMAQADLEYERALTNKANQPARPVSPWRIVPNMMSKSGKPIQQNEETGEVREVSLEAMSSSPRSNAMQSRTDYLNKALDYRQRDLLNKNTNLPGQQLKTLTQNNMRADRAIDLLSSPQVTWQKLNFALTDLGAIMQGGAPHKEELLSAQFPSWKQKVAQYRTYATGQPTANVPDPIKQEVVGMIQSLKQVDNKFLQQNLQNQEQMLGPTVQGFGKIKPQIEQGTQNFMQGTQPQQSQLGPTATGPNGQKVRWNGSAWIPA